MAKRKNDKHHHPIMDTIREARDKLLAKAGENAEEKEKIHAACMGMYKCVKDTKTNPTPAKTEACLNGILDKIKALEKSVKKGSKQRSRSKSKTKPKRAKSRGRSKSRKR